MLRPVGDLVATSWELYINDFKKYLPLVVLFLLPTPVLTVLGVGSFYLNEVALIFNSLSNIIILLALPVMALISGWAFLAATNLAHASTQKQDLTAKQALRNTKKLIWPAIYTFVPALIIIFFSTLLLIIPGLIFFVWYTFIVNALVVDNKRGFAALAESKRLVVGRWWAVAWRSLASWFCFAFAGSMVQIGLSFVITAATSSPSLQSMLNNNISAIINGLTTPLIILSAMVLYEDLKNTPLDDQHP